MTRHVPAQPPVRPYVLLVVAAAFGVAGGLALSRVLRVEPDASWPLLVLALVSLPAGLSFALAARRCSGPGRAAWAVLALSTLPMTTLHLLHATGRATPFAVIALTGLMTAMVAGAVLLFPGTGRSLRRWLQLILDGWLVGGAIFTMLWLAVEAVEGPAILASTGAGEVVWVLLDLLFTSVVIGLARRVPTRHRAPAVAFAIVAVCFCVADFYAALYGFDPGHIGRSAYVGFWIVAVAVAAVAPWLGERTPFATIRPDSTALAPVRLPYLLASIAIGLTVLAAGRDHPVDGVVAASALLLLLALVTSQVVLARANVALYLQASQQAEDFRQQATRDALTGLPNRREFTGRVQRALDGPGRGNVAVLFIDLDGFKDVNDTLGHEVGDLLLTAAAARLQREVREHDVVARFGGDEFVALLVDCTDEQARQIAERLREVLAEPYHLLNRDVTVSASIGLARAVGSDAASDALRNADLALYRAKALGRDRVATYHPDMHATAVRRVNGARQLRQALNEDRLSLRYQPVVDLRTGQVHAVEALLRFDQSDLPGWQLGEVIQVAADNGLMAPLGRWVVNAAAEALARWPASPVQLAVNVSARELVQGELAPIIERQLAEHPVLADRLVLEMTEQELWEDLGAATAVLHRLRAQGVRVMLDDFGTGSSSLTQLAMLPLDGLKIDGTLVARVGGIRDTVPTVLQLGRDLGLAVVAEGIETTEQLELLRSAGCRLGQGYLLGRPVDEARAAALVAAGRVPLPEPQSEPEPESESEPEPEPEPESEPEPEQAAGRPVALTGPAPDPR